MPYISDTKLEIIKLEAAATAVRTAADRLPAKVDKRGLSRLYLFGVASGLDQKRRILERRARL